jgi:hypothetical protein
VARLAQQIEAAARRDGLESGRIFLDQRLTAEF